MDKSSIVSYFRNQAISGDWASLYDPNNKISYPFIQRFIKTVNLMQPINGNILDMGCGTGILVKVVVDAGANYTGFDVAPEMIDACNLRFNKEIENNKAEFILADSSQFKSEKLFDQAVGMGYIEYFDNPDFGMQQAHSWLKSDGKLILSFPHKNSIDYLAVNMLLPFRKIMTATTGKKTIKPDRKMWTQNEAIALFEKHGFDRIKIVNYNVNLFHYPFNKIAAKLCNAFSTLIEHSLLSKISFLSTSFIISAVKK
jgi:2-polyprenyl-3-methyl-5-hydroxy-6-metoxy-1,4-benzoquinol methylase